MSSSVLGPEDSAFRYLYIVVIYPYLCNRRDAGRIGLSRLSRPICRVGRSELVRTPATGHVP